MADDGQQSRATALVTGAGRGIGRAIAVALGETGWHVVVNYRANSEAAEEAVRLVEATGARAVSVQADVADAADRERLVARTLDAFGRIDMLVNNAGMAPKERLDVLETTEASYDQVMAVNLRGPFFLTQSVSHLMLDLLGKGVIARGILVNVSSISAYTASVGRAEYCLSKSGVAMMTKLFADRLAGHGINVYEIRPGLIRTDMTDGVRAKYDELIEGGLTPIRRWGLPVDVAQAVLAIAEGRLPFSTGEVINVDGGFHLRRL